jgi:methylenetetrahydrofolate dehydrogenase (NADP+)/methenyltetrahydrofolate cyclohydrolase
LIQIADIIVSCVGKLDLIKAEDLKQNVVLIGVGFTYVGKKQILDFDLDEVVKSNKAFLVSNRINCTGKATINSLISNVVELYKLNWEV